MFVVNSRANFSFINNKLSWDDKIYLYKENLELYAVVEPATELYVYPSKVCYLTTTIAVNNQMHAQANWASSQKTVVFFASTDDRGLIFCNGVSLQLGETKLVFDKSV